MTQESEIENMVQRHGQAVVTMDVGQIMNDLTPEAMMKLQTAAGGGMAIQISAYEVIGYSQDGGDYLYDVKYIGPTSFTVRARWSKVGSEWKIVDADIVSSEPS